MRGTPCKNRRHFSFLKTGFHVICKRIFIGHLLVYSVYFNAKWNSKVKYLIKQYAGKRSKVVQSMFMSKPSGLECFDVKKKEPDIRNKLTIACHSRGKYQSFWITWVISSMLGEAAVSTCFYLEDRCHRQESQAATSKGVLNQGEINKIVEHKIRSIQHCRKKVFMKHFILDILWGNIKSFVIIRVVGEQCLGLEDRPHYTFHGWWFLSFAR